MGVCNTDMLDKRTIHFPSGLGLGGARFHHTIQNEAQFKILGIVYFWNSPFNVFGLKLTTGDKLQKVKRRVRRGL